MIGGLGKTTSLYAVLAAAGVFAGGVSAQAADLGGDCCADLEERVAELEATTVRKGTRKVALTVSGFVGHQIMYWDDGKMSDIYIGDGGNIFSRFRFVGTGKISANLTAGFTYEFGINANAIGSMNQQQGPNATGSASGSTGLNGDDLGYATQPLLRDSTVWLEHKSLGRVKLGHGSTATDNLVLIDLGGMGPASTPDVALYTGGFRFRDGAGNYSNANWQTPIRGHESWDTNRRNHIMYQTPTLAGFNIQTAFAEDNYWDVALRYAGEFSGFRLAFGIGYQRDSEFNTTGASPFICTANCNLETEEIKGSASILHVPTGLFVTGAAGNREFSGDAAVPGTKDASFWYVAGGISQNWFGVGKTVLFGEYSEHKNGGSNPLGGFTGVNTTVQVWGLGVNQLFDAAALEIFLTYKNFSLDLPGNIALVGTDPVAGAGVVMGKAKDLDVIIMGAKMSF